MYMIIMMVTFITGRGHTGVLPLEQSVPTGKVHVSHVYLYYLVYIYIMMRDYQMLGSISNASTT